jgi:hypothetical protein
MGKTDLLMDVMTNPNNKKKPKAKSTTIPDMGVEDDATAFPIKSPKSKKKKRTSRRNEWDFGCQQIRDGLESLQSMKQDYEAWKDSMPDSLQSGETYRMLEEISDLDLDGIESTLDEAEAVELPQGFGRD